VNTLRVLLLASGLALLIACGTDSQATEIALFTEEALRIENDRRETVEHWIPFNRCLHAGPFMKGGRGHDGLNYSGAQSLAAELALLEAPTVMQPIKDSMLNVYQNELAAAADHGERFDDGLCRYTIFLEINMYNVEPLFDGSPIPGGIMTRAKGSQWARAQWDRNQTYERWHEILRDNGLDPTLYPALVGSQTGG
jgi:hypothetical protein